ncbi:MAG: biotin--[acetyl-CoA-carboxylase] ligase [Bacteroidota bacterium]|nr:biotin--[acetyl-CoA-carboxylase] ligase [Bacteroidota bacterium]MEC8367368.1 biotin--[acetyl-CoA-carboxylase] ligase [Bacteroidota bacterium]MEC9161146.1 biotin--[acetyl-CoA-carboxylase] ligase [Bacteroidota bacterium]
MKLIKLNAIDSTNEYIKKNRDFFSEKELCVLTFNQTKGKGQRGNTWVSEQGSNLCISLYFSDLNINIEDLFNLNMLVSLNIIEILDSLFLKNLKIKWPNDILAENKKISGILIETFSKNKMIKDIIVGIGINVNQIDFNDLINATSMSLIMNKKYDLNILYKLFLEKFKSFSDEVKNINSSEIKLNYLNYLYGINTLKKFEVNNLIFDAKISDVNKKGELILDIDGVIKEFNNQEIKLIY